MNFKDYIGFSNVGGFFFTENERKEINTEAEMIYVSPEQKTSNNKTRIMNEIAEFNQQNLFGCSDWRLPTVAEAMKIVENHIEDIKNNVYNRREFITAEKGFFCIDSRGYICSAYFVDPSDNGLRIVPNQPKIYFDEFNMPHRNQVRKILLVRGQRD